LTLNSFEPPEIVEIEKENEDVTRNSRKVTAKN